MRKKWDMILLGALMCIIYWYFESSIHYFIFPNGYSTSLTSNVYHISFWREIFSPDAHELYTRIFVICVVMIFSVITQIIINRQRFFATHNDATKLPNKVLCLDDIQETINLSRKNKKGYILLIAKPNHLSLINRILSMRERDKILLTLAQRMKKTFEKTLLGSWRATNFVFLINFSGENDNKTIQDFLKTLKKLLQETVLIDTIPFHFELNVGACLYQAPYTAETWVQNAYKALAKSYHQADKFNLYHEDDDQESRQLLQFIGEFHHALIQNELMLYLQPKIELSTNEVVSYEALSRWNRPNEGVVLPSEYIAKVEESADVFNFARYNVDIAFAYHAKMLAQGNKASIAINLAAANLQDQHLCRYVTKKLAEYGISAEGIYFEITESTFFEYPKIAINMLNELSKQGFKISVDDFGTGFTSLSYLSQFKVDEIKIDRMFITGIHQNEINQHIVNNVIMLAHSMNASVCAEGIETNEEYQYLKSLNCDLGQGYYWSKPLPFEQMV